MSAAETESACSAEGPFEAAAYRRGTESGFPLDEAQRKTAKGIGGVYLPLKVE